jgi:hypothetical protein
VFRRTISVVLLVAGLVLVMALPAFAGHDHFVETPNGKCHQVAQGQTSIDDPDHGGYHKFHVNVHQGATENVDNKVLGKGHAKPNVYKDACP